MRTKLLVLGVASLLLSVEGVRAAPAAFHQAYVASVSAQADAKLANSGVILPDGMVKVRGVLSGDRLQNVHLAESTGDLAADRAVEQALRRLKVAPVPAELAGRQVTLTLGAQPIVQARTP
ncbi:hypothetical protein [Phenylobacterium sp.]|uniref:hypothetical protein n=1 Tax=Phenylobacterium sp. TaxID=1871053 RepID=UPI0035B1D557